MMRDIFNILYPFTCLWFFFCSFSLRHFEMGEFPYEVIFSHVESKTERSNAVNFANHMQRSDFANERASPEFRIQRFMFILIFSILREIKRISNCHERRVWSLKSVLCILAASNGRIHGIHKNVKLVLLSFEILLQRQECWADKFSKI